MYVFMTPLRRCAGVLALGILPVLLSCGEKTTAAGASPAANLSYDLSETDPLAKYDLAGDTNLVLDPSIFRQGKTYFLFSTDVFGSTTPGNLPIRCSQDQVTWTACGAVFAQIPAWLSAKVPGMAGLWAPDISYFNGLYHVYYSASTLGSQHSVIALATNRTLDRSDPAYAWVDAGEVIASEAGDDFNAIDPNVLVDTDGRVYLTYGSYWSGIKQQELDSATGELLANGQRYDLAARPEVANHPIEGASLVFHDGFYYLFVSIDYCCKADNTTDNYKQAVGRSASPHGPFSDKSGTAMLNGGSTVLLEGDATWNAPGGGTAHLDAESGEALLVFHALKMSEGGRQYVWLKHLSWANGWPTML